MTTESLPTPLAAYVARPKVLVDGVEDEGVNELMTALEIRQREGGMSSLELRLSNTASTANSADFAFEDDQVLRLGAAIAVSAGDPDAPVEIFRGTITGLEANVSADAKELVVLAEDAFQLARMARRTKVHDEAKIADLASALATDVGLTAVVNWQPVSIGTQVQLNESDLAFLRRLVARYDGDMHVWGSELHVSPRPDVQRGTLTLELHGQLRRARVLADLAHQVTAVSVTGWDPVQGQRVSAQSSGVNAGPGSGQTGSSLLTNMLTSTQPSGQASRAEHVGHVAVTTQAEAQAVADAAFDRAARRFVCVDATAEGNPALRVGTHVTLEGLGPRFDNTYYVVSATHCFDTTRGYETHFEAESAYWMPR